MTPDAETPLPDPAVVGYDLPRFTGSTDSRPPRTDWGLVAVSIIELRASVATDPDGSIVLNLDGELDFRGCVSARVFAVEDR